MAMRQSAQLHIQSVLYKLLRRYLEHWLKRTAEVRASWVHWHAAMRVASVGLPWDSCVSRRIAVMVCLMLVGTTCRPVDQQHHVLRERRVPCVALVDLNIIFFGGSVGQRERRRCDQGRANPV